MPVLSGRSIIIFFQVVEPVNDIESISGSRNRRLPLLQSLLEGPTECLSALMEVELDSHEEEGKDGVCEDLLQAFTPIIGRKQGVVGLVQQDLEIIELCHVASLSTETAGG